MTISANTALAGAALLVLLTAGSASAGSRREAVGSDFRPIWTTPAATPAVASGGAGKARFETIRTTMDRVFGPGRWRETGGYRSPAREDELRREGAGTVAPGHLSHHSLGTADAPGAYDVVVAGMSAGAAAATLKVSGAGFSKVLAEGVHGAEGSHLHIEPGRAAASDDGPASSQTEPGDTIYLRIVDGRRNSLLGR
jgi:hypothetical protein